MVFIMYIRNNWSMTTFICKFFTVIIFVNSNYVFSAENYNAIVSNMTKLHDQYYASELRDDELYDKLKDYESIYSGCQSQDAVEVFMSINAYSLAEETSLLFEHYVGVVESLVLENTECFLESFTNLKLGVKRDLIELIINPYSIKEGDLILALSKFENRKKYTGFFNLYNAELHKKIQIAISDKKVLLESYMDLYTKDRDKYKLLLYSDHYLVLNCNSINLVQIFLRLNDVVSVGENAYFNFYRKTIERLSLETPQCFLDAVSGLSRDEQNRIISLLKSTAHISYSSILHSLWSFRDNDKYSYFFKKYLDKK